MSAFNNEMVTALIHDLKRRYANKELLFESDYSRNLAAILPYYYKYMDNFTIAPEILAENRIKPDFTICKTHLGRNGLLPYGHYIVVAFAESKKRDAVSWWTLMKKQLWGLSYVLKNDTGQMWVIAQIGMEICIFHFDITKYLYPGHKTYTNFSPLNFHNFSNEDWIILEIDRIVETVGRQDVIQVIKWVLDKSDNHRYVHEMFVHITTKNP